MATRQQYQLAVTNAGINVRAKTQTLNEAQTTLSQAQAILSDLQSRSGTDPQSLLNAQLAVQNAQNAVRVAGIELNQAKTDLTSAQLELNSPDTVFDPEPTQASTTPTLTQAQRDRLDQINEERLNQDLAPLTPGDPAALTAINDSFAAEQTAQTQSTRDSASSRTAGDALVTTDSTPAETPLQQGLRNYNEVRAERALPPVGIDDPNFLATYNRIIAANPELGDTAYAERTAEATTPEAVAAAGSQNTGTDVSRAAGAEPLGFEEFQKIESSDNPERADPKIEPANYRPTATRPDGYTADGGYFVNASGTRDTSAPKKPNPKINVSSNNVPTFRAVENPLHAYASYTYGLSLHVLSPSDYKRLVDNPSQTFKPTVTLISSANKYGASPPRDKAFTDDFYFDNLKINTVIGLGHNSRGTNVNDMSFTLIEPYGMTLLNRLLDLNIRLKHKNYLDVPYLLEINFYGADDTGKFAKLDLHTKYIPIRLVTMKIKANVKGSEYTIMAIPYNKMSHLQSVQTTKANFEITSMNVGEFFKSQGAGYSQLSTKIDQTGRFNAANRKAIADDRRNAPKAPGTVSNIPATVPVPTIKNVSSFVDAFNLWQKQEVTHGNQAVADVIEFKIDGEISKATIVEPVNINPARSAIQIAPGVTAANDKSKITGNNAPKSTGIELNLKYHNITAGTSIVKVINDVLINSSFIRNQLVDPETGSAAPNTTNLTADGLAKAKGSVPVQWFKITSKIELLAFDDLRGLYGKKIIFYVNKYTHYETTYPGAPKSQPSGAVKQYDYFYTGKNRDIIDFDIEFKALFVNVVAVDKNKLTAVNTNPWAGSPDKINSKREIIPGYNLAPTQLVNVSGSQSSHSGGHDETAAKQQAANFADNIYSAAGGDMIELKMKIIGDPHFIKQDEILYSPEKYMGSQGQFVDKEGGSLSMDRGEIFCNVTFKTPVDIDETTGLLRQGSTWKDVYFSGLYKINTVENEFRNGKFIQNIIGFRIRNQKGDNKGPVNDASVNNANNRTDPKAGANGSNSAVSGKNANLEILNRQEIVNEETGERTIIINYKDGTTQAVTGSGEVKTITNNPGAPDRPANSPAPGTTTSAAATQISGANQEVTTDPDKEKLRAVTQSNDTRTIDTNTSDAQGTPQVGAPASATQVVAPPQPAPVSNSETTQTPPVQSDPRPAPATYSERQSDASEAKIAELKARGEPLTIQYQTLFAEFAPKRDALKEFDAKLDEIDTLLAQVIKGSKEYKDLVRSKTLAVESQQQLLASVKETTTELQRLASEVATINQEIATIKANTGNTQ